MINGSNRLISDSNEKHYGTHLVDLYNKLALKVRDSKKYKQLLQFRTTETNRVINEFFKEHSDLKTLIVEDLKYVRHNSTMWHETMNIVQRWLYRQVKDKLERFCDENGIHLIKVNPAYTSQTCSRCKTIDKDARDKKDYTKYHCSSCGLDIDADYNAAINIYNRGVIVPLSLEK